MDTPTEQPYPNTPAPCQPEFLDFHSGLWYRNPQAAGHVVATRCHTCMERLDRREGEGPYQWINRVAEWWKEHRTDVAEKKYLAEQQHEH